MQHKKIIDPANYTIQYCRCGHCSLLLQWPQRQYQKPYELPQAVRIHQNIKKCPHHIRSGLKGSFVIEWGHLVVSLKTRLPAFRKRSDQDVAGIRLLPFNVSSATTTFRRPIPALTPSQFYSTPTSKFSVYIPETTLKLHSPYFPTMAYIYT